MRSLIIFVSEISQYTSSLVNKLIEIKVPISFFYGPSAHYYSKLISESKEIKNEKLLMDTLIKSDLIGLNGGIDWIIKNDILKLIPILNIHPSPLPLNRGSHHSFWSIMNDEPHGATMHWMDSDVDTGPIIKKKVFQNNGKNIASMVQKKSEELCIELIQESILEILSAKNLPKGKKQKKGTSHLKKEIVEASNINIEEEIKIDKLLKLCRATCSKNNGFYILKEGKKYAKIIIKDILYDNFS